MYLRIIQSVPIRPVLQSKRHSPNFARAINPLNAELNPICHLLALLGGATIVVVSRLRVNPLYNSV